MNEPDAKKPVVLVIDDEAQIRRLLRVTLEMNGYEVAEAATGEAGLQEAVSRQPSIVLLDMGLPDMPGLAVLKRLREWSSGIPFGTGEPDRLGALPRRGLSSLRHAGADPRTPGPTKRLHHQARFFGT
jgi:CheY-like chemotaxis protein